MNSVIQKRNPEMVNVIKSRVSLYKNNKPTAFVFCYSQDPSTIFITKEMANWISSINESIDQTHVYMREVDKSLVNTMYIQRETPYEMHEMYYLSDFEIPIIENNDDIDIDYI